MARLTVQVTDEDVVEIDVGPGLPIPSAVALEFKAATAEQFDTLIEGLGGLEAFALHPDLGSASRFALKLCEHGEEIGSARVTVRATEALRGEPSPAFPLLARLQEQKAELEHRAKIEAS